MLVKHRVGSQGRRRGKSLVSSPVGGYRGKVPHWINPGKMVPILHNHTITYNLITISKLRRGWFLLTLPHVCLNHSTILFPSSLSNL